MQYFNSELIAPAVVALMAITQPFSPAKILMFNQIISRTEAGRITSAAKASAYVLLTFAVVIFAGPELMSLLGVDVTVLSAVGGLIIGVMGFNMFRGAGATVLYGDRRLNRIGLNMKGRATGTPIKRSREFRIAKVIYILTAASSSIPAYFRPCYRVR